MKIKDVKIKDLKPYENNPRDNEGAVEYVANSIAEFGFKVPLVIDKNNVIVCGHTRLKAAERLNMASVPCIVADDLTDDQIKAFRLADNKVSEAASWDYELLNIELEDINLDMEAFGFEFNTEEPRVDIDDGYYGDERERTYNSMNLHDFDPIRCAGKYDMPLLTATRHIPSDLISFNYVLNKDSFEKGVHFFIDDYQFERIWNEPHKYMDRLSQFDCCLTPDFSLYMNMPIAMQVWNTYRSRLVGQIMQSYGIRVIPTLSWSGPGSFEFCFDGIEPGGTVAVSTVGVMKDKEAQNTWKAGMKEAIRRIHPSHVVVYGAPIEFDYGCETTLISNHNTEKFSE